MICEKKLRTEKVIQFGEGGFLRGFVDWMLQKINAVSDFDGSVVVVQPIEKGMCDILEKNDCVYTHLIRGVEGVEKSVIDVISRCVKPYEDFNTYLDLALQPELRFVVSNTTEAGIVFDNSDTPEKAPYVSFPAKLTLLLKRRFELGLDGFIFLPCELIDRNGDNLKKCVLQYADLWSLGEKFKEWICAQGGDARLADNPDLFPKAKYEYEIKATRDGYISKMNAELIGNAAMELGAGRRTKDDKIDHTAGIMLHKKSGDSVRVGDTLATLYTNTDKEIDTAERIFLSSLSYSDKKPETKPLIYKIIK